MLGHPCSYLSSLPTTRTEITPVSLPLARLSSVNSTAAKLFSSMTNTNTSAMSSFSLTSSSTRAFHSSSYRESMGPETANLINVLGQEIEEEVQLKNEEEIPEEMDEILAFMNNHFNTIENGDSTLVKIESKANSGSNEKVTIEFDIQDTTEDELDLEALAQSDEQPEDYTVGSRGLITFNKGNENLFMTVVFTNHVFIEKVAHSTNNIKSDDTSLYWATFEEFSDEMKESFEGYLKEHNIGREVATYCAYLAYDKEKVSYINMIEGIKDFLEK